jgi:hypothetical protein
LRGGLSKGGRGGKDEEEGGDFHDGGNWRSKDGGVNDQGGKVAKMGAS